MSKIVIYTAAHCTPCQEIKDNLELRNNPEVEIVDIETDEGFARFSKEVLENGDGFVPSAYKDGQKCKIVVEDDGIKLDCPDAPNHEAPVG